MTQKKKLCEIAIISAGQSAPQGEHNYCDDGIPFIKAGNLIDLLNGKEEDDVQKVSESTARIHRLKLYPAGTVLFAKSGMSCMKGYVYQLKSPCYVVSHLACITATHISGEYLKYYFEFNRPNSLVKDESYPSISLSDIREMEISFGSNKEQQDIVSNLNKIANIIRLRRLELLKIDNLVKSQFIEMFGEVGSDKNGWGIRPFSEFCEINPKKCEDDRLRKGMDVSFVPMQLVSEQGDIDATSVKTYEEVQKGFTYFSEGDVIFAKITPCMENGKGAIARGLKNFVGFGSTEFHVIRPKIGVSNSEWIYTITSFPKFRHDASRKMTGSAGQRRVPASFLASYMVSCPPFELQEQFARFVEQTDKSKIPYEMEVAA